MPKDAKDAFYDAMAHLPIFGMYYPVFEGNNNVTNSLATEKTYNVVV